MRAPDPEVVDAVWETTEPMIPRPVETHPLGCHRPRISNRLCFWEILVQLVTGTSWVTVEAILERRVSDTTLRLVVMSGSAPECSRRYAITLWRHMTASSVSTCLK